MGVNEAKAGKMRQVAGGGDLGNPELRSDPAVGEAEVRSFECDQYPFLPVGEV